MGAFMGAVELRAGRGVVFSCFANRRASLIFFMRTAFQSSTFIQDKRGNLVKIEKLYETWSSFPGYFISSLFKHRPKYRKAISQILIAQGG